MTARHAAFALSILAALAAPRALAQPDPVTPLTQPDAQPRLAQPTITPAMASDAWEEERWADAADYYRVLSRGNPDDALFAFRFAYSLHADGQYRRAIPAHEAAAEFDEYRQVSLYNLGCAHSVLGNIDQAFAALNAAVDEGFRDYEQMARDEDLYPLHDDPRWSALVRAEPRPDPSQPNPRWVPLDDVSFILGEWEILDARGRRLGSMSLQPHESAFALDAVERLDGRDGSIANLRAMLFLDGLAESWRLVGVDSDGQVVEMQGQPSRNSRLELAGEVHTQDGESYLRQLTLSLRRDGNIDLVILESEQGDDSWRPVFEGTWRRLGIVPPPTPGPGRPPAPGRPYKPGLAGDKR